jgi:hypothetical protein
VPINRVADRLFLDSNPFDAGPADPIALTVHA